MLENLSFVLMGLAALVAIVTFLGAHSSPVNIPNISKAGCTVTAGLMILGVGAGLYEPWAKYNECWSVCDDAMIAESEAHVAWVKAGDRDARHPAVDHGDYTFVAPGRVDFLSCHKGALDKYNDDMRKYEKYHADLEAGIPPRTYTQRKWDENAVDKETKKKGTWVNVTGPVSAPEMPQKEDFSVTDERCQAQGRALCTTVCNDPEMAAEAAEAPPASAAKE